MGRTDEIGQKVKNSIVANMVAEKATHMISVMIFFICYVVDVMVFMLLIANSLMSQNGDCQSMTKPCQTKFLYQVQR